MKCYSKEYFNDCILKHRLYALREKEFDKIVGVVVLNDIDKRWGDEMLAYYIHNLVTDLETKSTGAAIIKYWEDVAIGHSKRKLRLDCQTENVKLILLKIRLSLY